MLYTNNINKTSRISSLAMLPEQTSHIQILKKNTSTFLTLQQIPLFSNRHFSSDERGLIINKAKKKDENVYGPTVTLPQTEFGMRANAPVKEPEIQKFWEDKKIYENMIKSGNKPIFSLHDGPPYANGDLHIGHALNKILKDFINKLKLILII